MRFIFGASQVTAIDQPVDIFLGSRCRIAAPASANSLKEMFTASAGLFHPSEMTQGRGPEGEIARMVQGRFCRQPPEDCRDLRVVLEKEKDTREVVLIVARIMRIEAHGEFGAG